MLTYIVVYRMANSEAILINKLQHSILLLSHAFVVYYPTEPIAQYV